jgi:uncharacterized protein (TIGR02266 family)
VTTDELIKRDTLAAFERALDDAVLVELDGAPSTALFEHDEQSVPPEPREPEARSVSVEDRRATPRYSLVEPAVVQVASWNELVTLYTKDISCGGMFVQTDTPPERDTQVAVQLLLPYGAGTLEFEGTVVHVVNAEQARTMECTAGFGLQFSDLTPERRRALLRLVEQAKEMASSRPSTATPTLQELGSLGDGGTVRVTLSEAEHRLLQELRGELAVMMARSDLEVLGLESLTDRNTLRTAFERLARRWHPSVANVDGPAEVRQLTGEIFLRVHEAYRRLRNTLVSTEAATPMASRATVEAPEAPEASDAGARGVVPVGADDVHAELTFERPRPPTGEAERATDEPPRPPTGESEPATDEPRARSRSSMSELTARSELLAAQLKRRAPATAVPASARDENRGLVNEALRLVAEKNYPAAIERLERALQKAPEQRLRVLLSVVQARQALIERDVPRARAHYEAVLELEPDNEVAKRELLMLSALHR